MRLLDGALRLHAWWAYQRAGRPERAGQPRPERRRPVRGWPRRGGGTTALPDENVYPLW